MEGKQILFLAAAAASWLAAHETTLAATVTLNGPPGDAGGTSSFNSGLNWSNGLAPTANNNYTVTGNSTTANTLRTPQDSNSYVFGGNSLTLSSYSNLLLKGSSTSATINNLILAGGSVTNGLDSTTDILAGNITLTAGTTSTIDASGSSTRVINITAPITGAGSINFYGNTTATGGITLYGSGLTSNGAFYGENTTAGYIYINDNTTGAPVNSNHFGSSTVTLFGGSLDYQTNGSANGSTTVTNLSAKGQVDLAAQPSNTNANLSITNLTTTATATMTFISQFGTLGSGTGNNGTVTITNLNGSAIGNTNNIIGGWATTSSNGVNSSRTDFASYNATNGLVACTYDSTTLVGAGSTYNVLDTGDSLTGNVTVNSVNSENSDIHLNGYTLTLNSGGLILGGSNHWLKDGGKLTAGPGGNYNLFVTVNDSGGGHNNTYNIRNVTISDNGSNPVTLVKGGTAELDLYQQESYTGGTIVNGGVLDCISQNILQFAYGTVTVNPGATLYLDNNNTSHLGHANTAANGGVVLNGGTLGSNGQNSTYGSWSFDGNISVIGSGLSSTISATGMTSSTGASGNALSINVATGATLNVTGTFGWNIFTTFPLTFTGSGTTLMAASNAYSGGTTISGGTVLANASSNSLGSGIVTVGSGGTLGGSGSVGNGANLLTVQSGGTISAGVNSSTSPTYATLATGSNSWKGGGKYLWKIASPGTSGVGANTGSSGSNGLSAGTGTAGTSWDYITLTALNVSDAGVTSSFSITPTGNFSTASGEYSWVIAQVPGLNNLTLPAGFTLPTSTVGSTSQNLLQQKPTGGAANAFSLDTSGFTVNGASNQSGSSGSTFSMEFVNVGGNDDLVLSYSATPEPGASLLLLGGAIPMMTGRRRRRADSRPR